ncbi:MAG: hypothetical protein M1840_009035 [Geoglossum simile]|nr:MAG: hypothetical protein M1840_009035 [Geoglossum simile]
MVGKGKQQDVKDAGNDESTTDMEDPSADSELDAMYTLRLGDEISKGKGSENENESEDESSRRKRNKGEDRRREGEQGEGGE